MFRVHACGLWDLNVICENLRLITLRSRLEVCEKEASIFFPVALRRPPRLLVNPGPLVNPRPGVRMFSSRRRRVSRQASPFLSLPHQSMCARIHRLNSRRIFCFLALHTMAILQAYQTNVLKEIWGDWSDSGGCKGAAQSHWLSTPHAPWGAWWRVRWPQSAICG